ncbi:MAG: sulfatase [Verrucomicrobia bacterium]|nr:sulfatase [Verrucomicrobiota bacterium]
MPSRRRLPLPAALAALAALASWSPVAAAAPRPNVLLLFSDDLRAELGCYGTVGIKTPHIDALARRSVRFDRAYVQFPLCNPSRSSLLTGRYPTATGVMGNTEFLGSRHPEWDTLPMYFRKHGYVTLRTGKIFHGGYDDTDAWVEGGEVRPLGNADRQGSTQDPKRSDSIIILEGDGENHGDYKSASNAIDYLRRHGKGDRPFFLACGFSKPHSPPTAPRKLFEQYDVDRIPLPADFAPRPTVPAGFPARSVPARNGDLFIGRDASEKEAREMKRAYWAAVSFVDAQVGRVLAALDELGLRENTVIVFWGDHGYHLGEKGKWSKHNSLWEVGLRVPYMISAPGVSANGQACARVVECMSMYPTLVDLCGLPAVAGQNGVSITRLLRAPSAAWDQPAISVCYVQRILGRSVRTDRWHYADWDEGRGGAMLIDTLKDPGERTNLAEDPTYAPVLAEMRQHLRRLPALTSPPARKS